MIDSNDKNVREGETRMLLIKRQEEKQKHNLLTEQVLEQLFFFCFSFRFPRLTEALFSFLLLLFFFFLFSSSSFFFFGWKLSI